MRYETLLKNCIVKQQLQREVNKSAVKRDLGYQSKLTLEHGELVPNNVSIFYQQLVYLTTLFTYLIKMIHSYSVHFLDCIKQKLEGQIIASHFLQFWNNTSNSNKF